MPSVKRPGEMERGAQFSAAIKIKDTITNIFII